MDTSTLAIDHLLQQVRPFTKSSSARLLAMVNALAIIDREQIEGDIVECGIWRGGNIILARTLSPHRLCWLYDTFAGMTLPQAVDVTRSGKRAIDSYRGKMKPGGKWSAVSRSEVLANIETMGVWDAGLLRFVEGPVEQTLIDAANIPDRIALLRLDTDWHASTKIELEVLYPRLQRGGILIVDDYGHWQGARKAVDDYFGGMPDYERIDYTAIMMRKP